MGRRAAAPRAAAAAAAALLVCAAPRRAAAAAAGGDACFDAMSSACGGDADSLGTPCQNCLIHAQGQLIAAGRCDASSFGTHFTSFCRCYGTPGCDAELRGACAAPTSPDDIETCVTCVLRANATLRGAGCAPLSLAAHCSIVGGGGAAPAPAAVTAPAAAVGDACFDAMAATCGAGNRLGGDGSPCASCLIAHQIELLKVCTPGQYGQYFTPFCDCGCTVQCGAEVARRCAVQWADDASQTLRMCVTCVLEDANAAALHATGCTAQMLAGHCMQAPPLPTPAPPPPTPAPTPCYSEMLAVCGAAGLGSACQDCLVKNQARLLANAVCSAAQFGVYFVPFCACHALLCTPAPVTFYTPNPAPKPVPPTCSVCPYTPGTVCCNYTLQQICYHPGGDVPCCDCGQDSCLCGTAA